MLEVVQVRSGRELSRFLALGSEVYRDYPRWVPPIWLHYRMLMRGGRFLLALEDGRPVARLGVKRHHDALHFGFFESLPGYGEACRALVDHAHRAAPHLPMRGPYHFRQEDPYPGLLVEGFDRDPYFLMPYHPPYYEGYLGRAGFGPIQDLYAYRWHYDDVPFALFEKLAGRAASQKIAVRSIEQRWKDIRALIDLFNVALADNWGFEPFGSEDAQELWVLSHFLLDPRMCALAFREGQMVGATVMLPDFAPLARRTGGKLSWRFWHGLWRARRGTASYRAYAVAVHPDFQATNVVPAMFQHIIRLCLDRGVREIEISWVLASNLKMNRLAEGMGAQRTKVYRLLERAPFA